MTSFINMMLSTKDLKILLFRKNGTKSLFLTVDLLLSYPLFMTRASRIKYKNAFLVVKRYVWK